MPRVLARDEFEGVAGVQLGGGGHAPDSSYGGVGWGAFVPLAPLDLDGAGRARQATVGAFGMAHTLVLPQSDYRVRGDFVFFGASASFTAALFARAQGAPTNYYTLEVAGNGAWQITQGGVVILSGTTTPGSATFELLVRGTSTVHLAAYRNGVLLNELDDPTPPAASPNAGIGLTNLATGTDEARCSRWEVVYLGSALGGVV